MLDSSSPVRLAHPRNKTHKTIEITYTFLINLMLFLYFYIQTKGRQPAHFFSAPAPDPTRKDNMICRRDPTRKSPREVMEEIESGEEMYPSQYP